MSLLRKAVRVWKYSAVQFITDTQNWYVFFLLFIYLHMNTRDIILFSKEVQLKVSTWFFPFIMSTRIPRFVVYIILVFLLCNIPYDTRQSGQVMVRSGKKGYFTGKILQVVFLSFLYFSAVAVIVPLLNIGRLEYNGDWGKVFGTLANTNARSRLLYSIQISSKIVNQYMPLKAFVLSYTLSILSGILIGVIICFCNLLTNNKVIGCLVCGCLCMMDFLLQTMDYLRFSNLIYLSPLTWSDIRYIKLRENTMYFTSKEIFLLYGILLIAFISLIFAVQWKHDIEL